MKYKNHELSWLDAKDVYIFFQGFCEWCELIRSEAISDVDLVDLFDQIGSCDCPMRSKALFKYKLFLESESRDSHPLLAHYYGFLDLLKDNSFWLNSAFPSADTDATYTFLSPQGFILQVGKDDALIQKISEPYALQRAELNIASILQKISNEIKCGPEFNSFFLTVANSKKPSDPNKKDPMYAKKAALAQIHYEVSENMDHWMMYPQNQRATEVNRKKLGDTLSMDIRMISIDREGRSIDEHVKSVDGYFTQYPAGFSEYLKAHISRVEITDPEYGLGTSSRLDLIEITYMDNGRGVLRNLENFSNIDMTEITLKDVVKRGLSARKGDGAGQGFTKIIEGTRVLKSFFFMHSGHEILTVSGHGPTRVVKRESDVDVHGTIISVVLPAVVLPAVVSIA